MQIQKLVRNVILTRAQLQEGTGGNAPTVWPLEIPVGTYQSKQIPIFIKFLLPESIYLIMLIFENKTFI